MPIQIKMNTNLSNSSHSHSRSTVQNQSATSSLGGLGVKSNNAFQNSMIGRVHLSKPGCSSCGH